MIAEILKPLTAVMEDGINLLCPDGERRHCFPVVAQYIADYEEQRVLAGIVNGWCPKCTIPSHKSRPPTHGLESQEHEKRTRDEATRLRSLYPPSSDELKRHGYKHVYLFTEWHTHSDIHAALAPDLLHQVSKCFYDYIHKWVVELISYYSPGAKAKGEIDARFSHMPPFHDLKNFNKGISLLTRWTGKEYKNMAKVYLGVIKGPPSIGSRS